MRRFFTYISVLLLLASCGGHKKAVRPPAPESSVSWDSGHEKGVNRHGDRIVEEARKWIGTPYKYGGENRKGTDCSGLTMVVYRDVAGIKIPRNSARQQEFCSGISKRDLSPGDLVFFTSSKRGKVSHVGIYAGRGKFIHASSSKGVMTSSLDEDYYIRHFHSAGRVPGTTAKNKNKNAENAESEPVTPRPFRFEKVDNLPGSSGPLTTDTTFRSTEPAPEFSRPKPVVITETIRVVEVRVDTVYIPVPSPAENPDSISSEVSKAFQS